MEVQSILEQLDSEIERLTSARNAIAGLNGTPVRRGRGRPKGSVMQAPKKRKSGMTPEGRARISAAMKARWAAKKKGNKSAAKG